MAPFAAGAPAVIAPPASPAGRIGAIPIHPRQRGSRGNPNAWPSQSEAACAAAAGGSPAGGVRAAAFASAIALEEGKAPEWIQLFPRGPELQTVSYDARAWTLPDPAAVAAASMADGLKLPIDWEHATARKKGSGERVPTAGWIVEMAVRDGLVMGRVEWTADGAASVESKEYLYFSPYFLAGGVGGPVFQVLHGGLVKSPAFVMPALAGAQAEGGDSMNKEILEALGLAAGASAAEALAAIKKIVSERRAFEAAAKAPPLDRFVPRADYDSALARASAAEGKLAEGESERLEADIKKELDDAQEAGKITPATRAYHEAQCRAEGGLQRFREFVAAAPEIAGGSGASARPPEGSAASAAERAVAKAIGHAPEFAREHGSQPARGEE